MNEELKYMFKNIIVFDVVLACISFAIIHTLFSKYTFFFIGGLAIALLSFLINGYITEYTFMKKKENHTFVLLIGFAFRVILVCMVGVLIYMKNELNVVAYMLGYSSHFVSITLYGIKINK